MQDGYKYTIEASTWEIGERFTVLTIEDAGGQKFEIACYGEYSTAMAKASAIITAIEGADL